MGLILIITFFVQGAGWAISAVASPGPFQTLLLSETLIGGFRRSAPIAFAPLITDAPIILLMLFVLKQLPPIMINLLNIAGGLFVWYLAGCMWKHWRANEVQTITPNEQRAGAWVSLRKGVVMNFLNPNPYLFWGLVTGPILLAAFQHSIGYGVAFLLGFYLVLIGGYLTLAAIFHQARRLEQRVVRWLSLVSIIILILFGGLLIKNGLLG